MVYWDVIVATIVSMILGFTWFGPLFGRQWTKLMGITPAQVKAAKKKGMPSSTYFWVILTNVVTVLVLSTFISTLSMSDSLTVAFMIWLGFLAPIQLGMVLWEGRPWALYLLTTSYYLVNLLLTTAILVWL